MTELAEVKNAVSEAQVSVLTQTTPKSVIKQRKGAGGKMLNYVEHSWVTATLNKAFEWAWSWEILEWKLIPEFDSTEAFVLGKLTVHTPRGDITKTQFGGSRIKRSKQTDEPLSFADDLKAASSDALKKAASLLGIALDLYSDDLPTTYDKPQPSDNNKDKKSFSSPQAAIEWAMLQGAFDNKPHAKNAYNKLRDDKQPTTADEMAELWRNDVADRLQTEGLGSIVDEIRKPSDPGYNDDVVSGRIG